MSSWKQFKDKFCNPLFLYGVATCSFSASSNDQLSLLLGDAVYIKEECDEWYYGCLANNPQIDGIFPKSFVHTKTVVVENNHVTNFHGEDPLATDLTGILREWGYHLEQFYTDDQKTTYNLVHKIMLQLIRSRRRLIRRSHTNEELIELKQTIVDAIDKGTSLLKLDLIVRDTNFNLANPSKTSTHKLLSLLRAVKKPLDDIEKPRTHGDSSNTSTQSMLVTLDKLELPVVDNSAELWLTLYDVISTDDGMNLLPSETFVIRQKDALRLNEHRVAFTDINRMRCLKSMSSASTSQSSVKYLVLYVIRIGTMYEMKDTDNTTKKIKNETNDLRRPCLVALINITQQLDCHTRMQVTTSDKELIIPFGFISWDERDTLASIIQKAAKSNDVDLPKKYTIKLQILPGGYRELKNDYPHILHGDVRICRKLDFPDVIMPDDLRNDIYITVHGAEFSKAGNYEYTSELCDENENPIRGLLNVGVNCTTDVVHRSVTSTKTDKPKWNETFRIAIPFSFKVEDMRQYHVRFLFRQRHTNEIKDKAEKPFALAFLPLIEKAGTVIQDGIRHLIVYKMMPRKNDMVNGYINLQAVQISAPVNVNGYNNTSRLSLDEASSRFYQPSDYFSPNYREHFVVHVKIVSTQLTQIPVILTLLTWTPDSSVDLEHLLSELVHYMGGERQTLNEQSPGISERTNVLSLDIIDRAAEVVKNLKDILDKLFIILTSQNTDANVNEFHRIQLIAFHALICILDLLSMKQFESFRTVLDDYIKNKFSSTLAHIILLELIDSTLNNYLLQRKDDNHCVKMLKQLEYLFKLVVRSRVLYTNWKTNAEAAIFDQLIKNVLRSFTKLLSITDDQYSPAQGIVLKLYPSMVFEMVSERVFNPVILSEITAKEFLAALPSKRLTISKLRCLNELARGPLISIAESRSVLLDVIMADVSSLCNIFIRERQNSEDFRASQSQQTFRRADLSTSFALDQRDRDNLTWCAKIVGNVMDVLFESKQRTSSDIFAVTKQILRVFMQILLVIRSKDRDLPIAFGTGIIAILRSMEDHHYSDYLKPMDEISLIDFFFDAFGLIKDLVTTPLFPNDWSDMLLLQNAVLVRATNKFASRLLEDLSRFNEQMATIWRLYFQCIENLITQPCLQLESFTANRRKRILSRYKDLRIEASNDFKQMWFRLYEHNKMHFIPSQVYGAVIVALIPVKDIRVSMLRILCDMIYVESARKTNFSLFENEFITVMDKFANDHRLDKGFKDFFTSGVDEFCKEKRLSKDGSRFVDMVNNQLSRLIELRTVVTDHTATLDLQMHCVRNLMEFYQGIHHQEMYVKYIYKLYDINKKLQNKIEAGYTLCLHAKLLTWNKDEILDDTHLKNSSFQKLKTHWELKKCLYQEIIKCFDDGQLWEKAIQFCKELQTQYESVFDYKSLSLLLQHQAKLYDNIMHSARFEIEYFRIGCYGTGFHDFLQNKVFVYRAEAGQRLHDIREKMQTLFPSAVMIDPITQIDDEYRGSASQYIQIQSVQPIWNKDERFSSCPVAEAILQYYRCNEITRFMYTRTFIRDEDRSATLDIAKYSSERYEFSTSLPLPNAAQWISCGESVKTVLSPLENAVQMLDKTHRELKALVEANEMDKELNVTPLFGKTAGILDAAVMGGNVVVEQAFLSDEYLTAHRDDHTRVLIENLKQKLVDQIPLLERALIIMKEKAKPEAFPHFEHLRNIFMQRQKTVERQYGKRARTDGRQIDRMSLIGPGSDFSSNISSLIIRSNTQSSLDTGISTPTNTSELSASRTSSSNSISFFKPTTTSSPQKTAIELREELRSQRPRRPRQAPSLSSSAGSLSGNESINNIDSNVSGNFVVASASQTLTASTFDDVNNQPSSISHNNLSNISPIHHFGVKLKTLTKSSENLLDNTPHRPPPKPPKYSHQT